MSAANGYLIFIQKAQREIDSAANHFAFARKYANTSEKQQELLDEANEKVYKAILDKKFFIEQYNRQIQQEEDFLFGE